MSWKMSGRVKEVVCGMNGQPITRTDKLILLTLADYYNENTKTSWPSLDTLAEECLCSKTSLWRSLTRLATLGLLRSSAGRWKDAEFYLLPDGDPPKSHSNLKCDEPVSRFKPDAITFQTERDHVSNQSLSSDVSIKEPLKKPIKETGVRSFPKPERGTAKAERDARKGKTGRRYSSIAPATRQAPPTREPRGKMPESFIKFAAMFRARTDVNTVTMKELWELPDDIIEELMASGKFVIEDQAWRDLDKRLSVFVSGLDVPNAFAARDFLEGMWRTSVERELKAPELEVPD